LWDLRDPDHVSSVGLLFPHDFRPRVEISPCGALYLGVIYAGKQHGVDVFHSGRNALNAGEEYMKLDLMFKFIVIFLFYVLADWPQVFRGIAAGIFLLEFSIVLMVHPCEQKRGNYFHLGSLAILVLSTIHTLIIELEEVPSGSLVPLITLGGGIVWIFLLAFSMIVRVKKFPSVHMLEAVGRANPPPEPNFRCDVDNIHQEFPIWGIVIEVVVTPLIANVVHEWSVDDACLPLQIWSIVVVVTGGIALWAFCPLSIKWDWSEIQKGMYFTPFVFMWLISGGVLLFSKGECKGDIFVFSSYVLLLPRIFSVRLAHSIALASLAPYVPQPH